MARSIPALVKPSLLRWARESVRLSFELHADDLPFDTDLIKAWENGEGSPTIPELRKLGKAYKRPLAVFFLAEPPTKFDAQREFRRLPEILPGQESPALMFAIRQAAYHREAAIELAKLTGTDVPELGGSLHPGMESEKAGQVVRSLLALSWQQQLDWSSPHAALAGWRAAVESLSILVFQAGGVELDEMRGTCLPDQPFPIILVNSKDAPHGRVFTLLHEFIHILFHASGHQTSRMEGRRAPEEQSLEVAANAFTSSTLLPSGPFIRELSRYPAAAEGDDEALRLLSQRVKVSPEAVLRRLADLGLSSRSVYRSKRAEWGNRLWYVRSQPAGAIPQSVKVLAREGKSFARLVFDAYDRNLITTSTASDYLGTKPVHFPNIRRDLFTRA
jgi:Zn-dependent peptidase ImmA (M78 family)